MLRTFISYRRDDTAGYAGRLRESLDRRLGEASVFRDLDGLRPGDDFVRKIDERIANCPLMLVLIGRHWVDARDQAGARRLEDPLDFVRLEVSKALAGSNVVVVPVLVDGASMPSGRQLPDDLQLLTRRHAMSLRDETWDADIDRLVAVIRDVDRSETSTGTRVSVGAWIRIGVGVIVVVAAVVAMVILNRTNPQKDAAAGVQVTDLPGGKPTKSEPPKAVPAEQPAPTPQPAALLTVRGPITFEVGAIQPTRLKVALVWAVKGHQPATLGVVGDGPDGRTFSIPIYSLPPESSCLKILDERLGIANIVAFDDLNDDGLFEVDELIGGVPDYAVTFASDGLPEALRQLRKNGRPPETLLQIRPGLSLSKGATPEEQGRAGGFDDLVPVPSVPVTLVIVRKGQRPHFVNWT